MLYYIDRSNQQRGLIMNTNEITNNAVQERISEFHSYLNEGLSIESARTIILESTCIKAVKKYINEYK